MKMLRLLLATALALAPFTQALAGAGTITTKDAGGVTRTFVIVTDGTGNFVAPTVVCDATAAATCAAVGANGLAVSATLTGTVPLPTGAATSALQTTGNTTLSTINTTLGSPLQAGGTVVITGVATAANQATEIASLSTIASNTGAAIPAGSALIGKVGFDQTTPGTTNAIRTTAGATGGGTLTSAIAPATPAGVNLKASAGTVFKVLATTIQATPVYIKFYNSASAPTCGSGTPVGRFMVPVASTAANGAGTNIDIGDIGAAFGTGIGYCVTGALADADTTAITASNTLVNIVWN